MPFSKDPGVRENPKYCSYCFKDGKLCYEGTDLKEFQRISYQNMRAHGTSAPMAWLYSYLIRFAPRWRGKRAQLSCTRKVIGYCNGFDRTEESDDS